MISKTPNGMLAYCAQCRSYQLEFGNLFFQFTEEELDSFREYLNKINGEYYEKINQNTLSNRKIFMRLPAKCVFCALYLDELHELRALVHCTTNRECTYTCIQNTPVGKFCMN